MSKLANSEKNEVEEKCMEFQQSVLSNAKILCDLRWWKEKKEP